MKVLCPAHKDTTPSLHLYAERAYCFVCGYHCPIDEIATSQELAQIAKEPTDIRAELQYIHSLPLKQIRGLSFPEDSEGYYIVWPNGEFYKKRLYGDRTRYLSPRGHPLPLFTYERSSKDLVIVEGEINARTLYEFTETQATISSPGGVSVPKGQTRLRFLSEFLTYDRIVIIVDKDIPGVCWGLKVKQELLKQGKRVQLIALEKDLNQILQEGGPEAIKAFWKTNVDLFEGMRFDEHAV